MDRIKETDSKELRTSRVIEAPAEKIFKAVSEAKHLQNWWGPKGFTNTFSEFNFEKDGVWNFVMHGPDGRDYENRSVFREIVKPNKIVIEHINAPHFFLTISIKEESGKSKIGWSMIFDSVEMRNNVAGIVKGANEENLDRLEQELEFIEC